MRIVLRDGVELRVEDRGDAGTTPVLLVHGFTGSVEAWSEDLIRTLGESGRRVVAVDLPGHGRSEAPTDPDRYAMERVVEDLVQVLDHLEIPRADWIGYSMGGRVSLGGAVLRPRRIRRLVLEGASPGIADPEEASARRRADEALADAVLSDGLEAFVDAWMDKPIFRTQRRLPEERRARERRRRMACRPEGLAHTLRGLGTGRQPSFWSALPEVRAPTLLLTGADDEKYARIAQEMAERIPDAAHVPIPEAGHAVHLERPSAWLREVVSFLDGRSGEGESGHEGSVRGPESSSTGGTPSHRIRTPSTTEGGRTR